MNLVIVESPHKAETIQRFLGTQDYVVVSSKGHIRDLVDSGLGVDIEHGFAPQYVIPAEKRKLVAELKKLSSRADKVLLASDEDREGEAISWHLTQALSLDPSRTERITFHEITKTAILDAVQHPRQVDINLVNAQQARRVLDRLVGYELSPVLWRKIKRGLSAGRVQSVALRLIVDREKEIEAFGAESYYKVTATFTVAGKKVTGTLETRFGTVGEAEQFLRDSVGASYSIAGREQKEAVRHPAPPFTTSTLQQEAGRKLRFPVNTTMRVAQSLYERGLITYMRTDSVNLSSLALGAAKQYITENFGGQYSHVRQYKTRSAGAQEAHEAIRPTFIADTSIEGTPQEQKLYNLIWKRTVASQMSDARVLETKVSVSPDTRPERYALKSLQVLFDGFLRLYSEGTDSESEEDDGVVLPEVQTGTPVQASGVQAVCKFTQAPARYTQPALVKKLEELGIGRPSTYGTIISTLTSGRGYVTEGDKPGRPVTVTDLSLSGADIVRTDRTENVGADRRKLLPTEIGVFVTDYLVDNFGDILDYKFTAGVEESFDKIASGRKEWAGYIGEFYAPFHARVEAASSDRTFRKLERVVGTDPATGLQYVARLGQFGPYVQRGAPEDKSYAKLEPGQLIESITLEEAVALFALPRALGQMDGEEVRVLKGRFGPYVKCGGTNVSLPRGEDPMTVSFERCRDLLEAARNRPAPGTPIVQFGDISVLNGRYGPYIKCAGVNYRIPKDTADPSTLTEEQCRAIIASQPASAPRKFHKSYRSK